MKKKTIIFQALMLLTATSVWSQHLIHYTNENDGYSVQFPEDWRRADEMKGKLSLVALAPEFSEAEDGVREQLHIAVFDMKAKNGNVFYNQYKESHKDKNRSWKLVEDGEVGARGTAANYFNCYYSDTATSRTHSEFIYFYFKDGKAFVLTCTTSFDESDKYKDLFIKIATSFSYDLAPEQKESKK